MNNNANVPDFRGEESTWGAHSSRARKRAKTRWNKVNFIMVYIDRYLDGGLYDDVDRHIADRRVKTSQPQPPGVLQWEDAANE